MTTTDEAAPATLAARAGQVRFLGVLDVAVTGLFTAIGWVLGTLWFAIVITVMSIGRYCLEPVAWGFRAGAHRPQPDENKPEPSLVRAAGDAR